MSARGRMDAAVTREGKGFRVSYCCPWCGVNGNALASGGAEISRGDVGLLVVCPGASCRQPALVTVHRVDLFEVEELHVTGVHPSPRIVYDVPGVPDVIKRDFQEALNCRESGYNLGAATTARRALQAALVQKGASDGDKLVDQINAIDDETLPRKLKLAAHQVRLIGNDAAHPGELEQLLHAGSLDTTDVDALLSFAEQVFHMLYVLPFELDRAQAKRPLAAKHTPSPLAPAAGAAPELRTASKKPKSKPPT